MTEHENTTTPPGDRWDTSGLPPEPAKGSALVDRDGNAWVRPFDESHWHRGNVVAKWSSLVIDHGPLTRLVPADRTTTRFRAAVVREARRLIDQYDGLADGEVVTLLQLREAVRALDEHLTRKDQS